MHTLSILQIHNKLKNKDLSYQELLEYFIARIKKFDSKINSVLNLNEELAQAKAKKLDAKPKNNNFLAGIPILHKDIFCTKDSPTTCASKMLQYFQPNFDATPIARLAKHGAIMLGKTNLDEFAMGSSGETSYYGATHNPWQLNKTPGGSSSGSAAAISAGFALAATASDTGGSIRQPAALSGCTGLKPSFGRVSRYGMITIAHSFDQCGPIAKTAQDCAIILQAIAGKDKNDLTSATMAPPNYLNFLDKPLAGCKIGIIKEFAELPISKGLNLSFKQAQEIFINLGAHIVPINIPHIYLSTAVYLTLATSECSINLANFNGIEYANHAFQVTPIGESIKELIAANRSANFGVEVKKRILIGKHLLQKHNDYNYIIKAQAIRKIIYNEFLTAFNTVDVMLTPTHTAPARDLGDSKTNSSAKYNDDVLTNCANLAGLPAISFLAGFENGLPLGLQLIAKPFAEETLLNLTHQYQLNTDWHQLQPQLS